MNIFFYRLKIKISCETHCPWRCIPKYMDACSIIIQLACIIHVWEKYVYMDRDKC